MTVDHVGIAVESIDGAAAFYRDALGLEIVHREDVPGQKVRVAFLQAGETALELLEPLGTEGPVAKFLKERGPGLHHLAFKTDDIDAEMRSLTTKGMKPLEDRPRAGARGHLVCFLHPRYAKGVLVELVGHGR